MKPRMRNASQHEFNTRYVRQTIPANSFKSSVLAITYKEQHEHSPGAHKEYQKVRTIFHADTYTYIHPIETYISLHVREHIEKYFQYLSICGGWYIRFTLLYFKMDVIPLVPETKMADISILISLGNLLARRTTWLLLKTTSPTSISSRVFGAYYMTTILYKYAHLPTLSLFSFSQFHLESQHITLSHFHLPGQHTLSSVTSRENTLTLSISTNKVNTLFDFHSQPP